jgi:hypothetical protein
MRSRFILSTAAVLLLTAAGGSAQDAWKEFTWKEGKCSVLLPGKPMAPKGQAKTLQVSGKEGVYILLYEDNPAMAKAEPATIKQVFDAARDGLVKTLKGKLLSDKEVKAGKYPGRELQIETPMTGTYRTRLYQVGPRYYQLILVAPKEAATSKDADKFFGSFKPMP